MKRILILTLLFLCLLSDKTFSQNTEYPIHLFLGGFTFATERDTTVEIWDFVTDSIIVGRTIFYYEGGGFLAETMRLTYINDKLNYCATIMEQDPENPEGEICFELKLYTPKVFTFENLKHDFPKRIIYDFSGYRNVKARIEGDTSGFDFEFIRDHNEYQAYDLNGRFIKEPFVNKVGKVIEGVFDYYFEVQGIKYFIKYSSSEIKTDAIEKNLNKEVKASVIITDGLWDTDDKTHQSRVGQYINVVKIY